MYGKEKKGEENEEKKGFEKETLVSFPS